MRQQIDKPARLAGFQTALMLLSIHMWCETIGTVPWGSDGDTDEKCGRQLSGVKKQSPSHQKYQTETVHAAVQWSEFQGCHAPLVEKLPI